MTKNLRMTCKICNADLAYPSLHCDDCIKLHRVCRMCELSIADLRSHAECCGADHRSAARYQEKNYSKNVDKNVENVENVEKPAPEVSISTSYEDAILAELRALRSENADLKIQLAQTKEDLGTQIQGVQREVRNMQVTTITTVRSASPPQNHDDLDDLIQDRELTDEERAERGRQATQNFLSSLAAMAATSKSIKESGPKKMDVPQFDAPSFDDLLDDL